MSKESFLKDRRTQQAVVLNLMTIGEVAARIANDHKEFAEAHPEIPWAQARGLRSRMVHGYFDIDLNIVWQTVQSSLPELESHIAAALEKSKARNATQRGQSLGAMGHVHPYPYLHSYVHKDRCLEYICLEN